MSITYPISLPSSPGPSNVEWAPMAAVAALSSVFTFQQQVQTHAGRLWAVKITYPKMVEETAGAWIAALLSLNGRQGTFLFGDSIRTTPYGSASGTPLVKGAGQTGLTLVTDGWTPSTNGLLKGGIDWIQLGGSGGTPARLYKVIKDVNSNGSGEATIDIWPNLRESPADNAALVLTSCKGTFRLKDNVMDWGINSARHYGIEIEAVEAI